MEISHWQWWLYFFPWWFLFRGTKVNKCHSKVESVLSFEFLQRHPKAFQIGNGIHMPFIAALGT